MSTQVLWLAAKKNNLPPDVKKTRIPGAFYKHCKDLKIFFITFTMKAALVEFFRNSDGNESNGVIYWLNFPESVRVLESVKICTGGTTTPMIGDGPFRI